ncbi:MAG: putative bifunctional diguanylate cyclase/phosphodiesterase [Hyphomicrobiaceae bacterium]
MLKRSHIQAILIASIVVTMGAIPVLFAVQSLRSTQQAVVQSRNYEAVIESTFDLRLKVEKHILYFVATALDLDDDERKEMLQKADRHLKDFRLAVADLSTNAVEHILPTEQEGLRAGLAELQHNWEEITRSGQADMSNAEKTWHFLGMVENFEKLNQVLSDLHRRVTSEHEKGNRTIFSSIELAILTIVALTIVGTILASAGLVSSGYFLHRSRAQAVQLRNGNDLLKRREETLHRQAAELKESNALLKQREEALRVQSDRFSSAIEHMAQGLCMIDEDRRLITWNAKFATMYGVPDELLREGAPYLPVLEHRIKSGSAPSDCADFIQRELGACGEKGGHREILELPDGRFIATSFEPTPEGGLLSTYLDITQRRRSEQQVIHLAHHDELTDLLNRRFFVERLERMMEALGSDDGLAYFAIDLDDFKLANDSYGHAAGDLILQTVARRLKGCTRGEDLVARLGGDEFAVVLAGEPCRDAASKFASRIIEDLSAPYDYEGQNIEIGTSVGVALAPHDAGNVDQLMKVADVALYQAKGEGRNLHRQFTASLLDRMLERRELEEELCQALDRNQIELYYQPLICARSGQVGSMEALVRWKHPKLGSVPPSKFIPIAEDLGLMGKLGAWVIERACFDARDWPSSVRAAVNVSAAQFQTRALELDIALALGKSGLTGDRLEIEITESVLLDDEDIVLAVIAKVQEMGITVSLDDFGTGYSSLSYLHKYPLDKIKIDRSFVTNLPSSKHSQSIVRTIVGLAKSLSMSIIAEGIETEEQLALLKDEGCDQLQGFLISEPIPAAAAMALIGRLNAAQSETNAGFDSAA